MHRLMKRRHHCRPHAIAFIIDHHCFFLSKPWRRHHHHPHHWRIWKLFMIFAHLAKISLFLLVCGVLIRCCSKKCTKKRLKNALSKLATIENQDGSHIYMLIDGK